VTVTRLFPAILAITTLASTATPSVAASAMMQPGQLRSALEHGGFVILLRHADTDKSRKDPANLDLADCKTQRVLTPKGRMNARAIGQAVDRFNIAIGEVISSPLCRTLWTGELAFGHAEANPGLREPKLKNNETGKAAAAVLAPLISAVPMDGVDTVVVTHGFNIKSVTGFQPAEGEAVIIKPRGNGSFTVVGRILSSQWASLS